jgi:uncharacterized membrane protein YedE/YeeE
VIARLSALAAGFVFGIGLWLSGMTDPARVLGFLDVGGRWDPSLLFVLGGAVGVTLVAFRVVLRREAPALGGRFDAPARRQIDRDLLLGSALFGAGWGLGGLCPGPALSSLPTLAPGIVVFVLAMVVGGFVYGPAKRTDRS